LKLLTIFTPTYNRATTLPDLYDSLILQSNHDFNWLIVDDGSTDNTESIVNSWIIENYLSIVYYKQQNFGKHIAHNKGLELCETELFFCVDSDDKLSEDAVHVICNLNSDEETNDVLGFYLRKGDFHGIPIGDNWPKNIKYAFLNELYQKYNFKGEMAIILKTKLIKKYCFPTFYDEKFVRETVFYDQINNIAPMRLENKVCYLFKYQEDGYTAQGMKLEFKNPIGTGYNYLHHIEYTINRIEKCKLMGMFYAWKKVMSINDPSYKMIRIPTYVRLLGLTLERHYKKMYIIQKKALSNEI